MKAPSAGLRSLLRSVLYSAVWIRPHRRHYGSPLSIFILPGCSLWTGKKKKNIILPFRLTCIIGAQSNGFLRNSLMPFFIRWRKYKYRRPISVRAIFQGGRVGGTDWYFACNRIFIIYSTNETVWPLSYWPFSKKKNILARSTSRMSVMSPSLLEGFAYPTPFFLKKKKVKIIRAY